MAWAWVLYANAYEVTQAYGGREEGGWWYDVGVPLASIPIEAKLREVPGCQCEGSAYANVVGCQHTKHGDAPGEACLCFAGGECSGACEPCGCRCHERALDPVSEGDVEYAKARLEAAYVDKEDIGQRRGRTSCAGGYDVWIMVEEHQAEAFPQQRPHYE